MATQNGVKLTQKTINVNDLTVNTSVDLPAGSMSASDIAVPTLKIESETFAFGDMTDGGGAAATMTLGINIPEGAVVARAFIDAVTGFAGDTSAVMTIGDGTDVDRYNTGTPNVFATADHIDAGAVSGTIYHAAAKDVVVTITSGADWGSVTAGAVTITVYYYQSV